MTVHYDKGRDRWRYDFEMRGERHQGYCLDVKTGEPASSRTAAEAAQEQVRARLRVAPHAPAQTARGYTLDHAFAAYAATAQEHDTWPKIKRQIDAALAFFGGSTPAASIDLGACNRYVTHLRAPIEQYVGGPGNAKRVMRTLERERSNATINRYLMTLRTALGLAFASRDPLTQAPLIPAPPQVPKLKESEHLPRPIPDADLARVIAAARVTAPHVADAATVMRSTGMRVTEAFGITVAHLDVQHRTLWLRAADTKADRDEALPLNTEALAFLVQLAAQARKRGTPYLFAYRAARAPGKPPAPWGRILDPKRAWARACKAAGVAYGIHAIKAAFVTAVGAVASGPTTQSLGRHKSPSTTARYLKVSDANRRAAIDAVGFSLTESLTVARKPRQRRAG